MKDILNWDGFVSEYNLQGNKCVLIHNIVNCDETTKVV